MRNFPLIIRLLLLTKMIGLSPSSQAAPAPVITWESAQPIEKVRPQIDPLTLTIHLKDAAGRPLPKAWAHISLQAPTSQSFVSTDFPIVEGTMLFDSTVMVLDGLLPLTLVPPIRGQYRFAVELRPIGEDAGFAPARSEWHPSIGENPAKKHKLMIFLFILAAAGLGCGLVIGLTRPTRTLARSLILSGMLLVIGFGGLSSPADAHGKGHAQAPDSQPAGGEGATGKNHREEVSVENSIGHHLLLSFASTPPRVGELSEIHVSLRSSQGLAIPFHVELSFTQLEHGREVFRTEAFAAAGEFTWQGQFYDGSTHNIKVRAVPIDGSPALVAARDIEVEGIAPPPVAIIKSFGLLLALVSLAVGFGCCLGLRLRRLKELAP